MTVRKQIAFILAVMTLITCCFTSSVVSAASNVEDSVQRILGAAEVAQGDSSYAKYLSANSNINVSSNDVKVDIGAKVTQGKTVSFTVDVAEEGYYTIGMCYKVIDSGTQDLRFGLKIDGKYPYDYAEKLQLPRMWCDAAGENRVDGLGNEFAAQQVPYENYCYNTVVDETLENGYELYICLSKGVHTVDIIHKDGEFSVKYFKFGKTSEIEEYKNPKNADEYYKGEPIIIEGENAKIKTSNFLIGKSDSSTIKITPHDSQRNVVNYIGGGNWKTIGDTIIWETPEVESGYYQLGFSYRQNTVIGGKVYRDLTIDGETPFSQASAIGFTYDDNWKKDVFADDKGNPYMIYLSKGKHEIALTVVPGDIYQVRSLLTEAVAELGELYVDITMITGETVDIYRDYNLFKQIPNMEQRLKNILTLLNESAEKLLVIMEQDSGSNYSVIKNMVETVNQMLKNKYEAHTYKNSYYSNYCSVSSVLQELRNMPLDLDKIVLFSPEDEEPFGNTNFLKQILFSVTRFFSTFVRDYNEISNSDSEGNITIWVNWGRDQAQVLSSLIDRSFVAESGINVNMQLVNATVVQAILSGNGPDCILQHTRSEPVNLAMRGALYDLSQFEDCDEVLKRFQKGAEEPYRYKGGLYALPDTQTFFMMFYRKDILEEFGIAVPETWEDFNEAAKTLMRHNMSLSLPNTPATDASQINAGVGSINIFPSLLLQNGLSLYADDGKSTNLLSANVIDVFGEWTDFYRKQKFPISLDFYNRFRIGITPIGISPYTLYTTLKVTAPEIDGLWGMTYIPGTENKNGTVSHASSGGGTGCAILRTSKNPEKAWEFLKWWTRADTQLSYSNDVESILGPVGRVASSNVEAIKGLSWDEGMLEAILKSWEQVEEIPEYPGSYYVTRSIYQSFWNIVNANLSTKDTLMRYGNEANDEIARKWAQYSDK
ncbi:MAG: extracellular solute-binding protein [Clostridia bacterium]|nr:extracellular solute-binding protein [Clostridia bacterium]